MTTTRVKERTHVEPSARDPIASWLDVFVGLLHLPKDQKCTIRDELEDHLRSRVDDLLITGITESEATQRAVAELGETAELAQSFRAAARPSHTRRLIMTASICTILGAATVLGLTTVTGSALNANHAANSAIVSTQDNTLAVRGKTFGELFSDIADRADRPLLVHWDRLGDAGIEPGEPVELDVDPLPAPRLHQLLSERAAYHHGESIAVIESEDIIEITTRSHEDARTTSLQTYDVRDLVELHSGMDAEDLILHGESGQWRSAAEGVFETIVMLADADAWAIMGGDIAHGRLAGASLLIDAPERLHKRVIEVLAMMRQDADRTRDESNVASVHRAKQRQQRIDALRDELQAVAEQHAQKTGMYERLRQQMRGMAQEGEEVSEGHLVELARAEVEQDLAKRRVDSLVSIIADFEAKQMVAGSGR